MSCEGSAAEISVGQRSLCQLFDVVESGAARFVFRVKIGNSLLEPHSDFAMSSSSLSHHGSDFGVRLPFQFAASFCDTGLERLNFRLGDIDARLELRPCFA